MEVSAKASFSIQKATYAHSVSPGWTLSTRAEAATRFRARKSNMATLAKADSLRAVLAGVTSSMRAPSALLRERLKSARKRPIERREPLREQVSPELEEDRRLNCMIGNEAPKKALFPTCRLAGAYASCKNVKAALNPLNFE